MKLFLSNSLIKRAEELKADAYLSKDATIEELRNFIFKTHSYKFYVNPAILTNYTN